MSGEKPTNPKDAIGIRKAPLSTVPMNVIAEVGVAMLEGASKYGRHNYRGAGVRASVYFDAAMRHLIDWWEGQDIDPESDLSHITKLLAGMVVLRDSMLRGNWTDDRPPKSKPFRDELNAKSCAILDKYADKNPKHWVELDKESKWSTPEGDLMFNDNGLGVVAALDMPEPKVSGSMAFGGWKNHNSTTRNPFPTHPETGESLVNLANESLFDTVDYPVPGKAK